MALPQRGIGYTLVSVFFVVVFGVMIYTVVTVPTDDANYAAFTQSPALVVGFVALMVVGMIGVVLAWLGRRVGIFMILAAMVAFFVLAAVLDMLQGTLGLQIIGGMCGFGLLWYQIFYQQHKVAP
jgi:hypothetical protein